MKITMVSHLISTISNFIDSDLYPLNTWEIIFKNTPIVDNNQSQIIYIKVKNGQKCWRKSFYNIGFPWFWESI